MTTAPPVEVPVQAVAPRRRRRWRIALACVLGLLAIPVIGYRYLRWSQERDLQAAIAEIEAVDPRWRFEQLLADRPPIADADNPAIVVAKVGLLLRPGYDIGQNNVQLFNDMSPVHQLSAAQIAALRPALAKRTAALKLARTLKDFRGEGRCPITRTRDLTSTSLGPLQDARLVMQLLHHDAMLRSEDGDIAGAMESCRALLVVARSVGDELELIAALMRYAAQTIAITTLERVLAQQEAPAAELQAIQHLLAREIEAPILLQALRGERGFFDMLFADLAKGQVQASILLGGPGSGPFYGWDDWYFDRFPSLIGDYRVEQLRLMTEAVEAAKLPCEKQQAAFAEVHNKTLSSNRIVSFITPGFAFASEAYRRAQANLRCAIVGVAAERYRIRHGQWPLTVAELVADGLLESVPRDPYDGQPLRYRLAPDGVVIYAVGLDGVDDGGRLDRKQPNNPGADQGYQLASVSLLCRMTRRTDNPGTDRGFQLWHAAARRQAPIPPRPDDAGAPP